MPNYARRNYYVYHYKNGIRAARCGFVRLVTQPGHTYFLLQFSHEGDIDSDVYTFTVEENPAWISRTFCGRGTICGHFLRLEMQISGEWTPQGLLCGTRQDFYAVCFRGELTGALPFQKPQTTTDYGCRILEHFPQIPEFSHPGLARQIQMSQKILAYSRSSTGDWQEIPGCCRVISHTTIFCSVKPAPAPPAMYSASPDSMRKRKNSRPPNLAFRNFIRRSSRFPLTASDIGSTHCSSGILHSLQRPNLYSATAGSTHCERLA